MNRPNWVSSKMGHARKTAITMAVPMKARTVNLILMASVRISFPVVMTVTVPPLVAGLPSCVVKLASSGALIATPAGTATSRAVSAIHRPSAAAISAMHWSTAAFSCNGAQHARPRNWHKAAGKGRAVSLTGQRSAA